MLRAPKKLPKPKIKKKKDSDSPSPPIRHRVYVTKGVTELLAYWHPGNGMSCPHCAMGKVAFAVDHRCAYCNAVVTRVEDYI